MSRFRSKGLPARAGGLFFLLAAALPLAALSVGALPVAAQETVTLRGRVADAADSPIAGAVILLHAIGNDAGRELARDTADAAGAFDLAFTMEDGPLYFVATRVDGEIFMGDPFRELPDGELVLRAGAGVEPLRLDGRTPGPAMQTALPVAPRESGRALLWVLLIGTVVAGLVGWVIARGRRRAPRTRELLLEIARLDEARAAAGAAQNDAWSARREELRARLVEALELDPHADRH